MRFATWELPGGQVLAGTVSESGLHVLPDSQSIPELVRSGLDAALAEGERALARPAAAAHGQARVLPPLTPPSVRDFVAFEEHVEGVVAGFGGGGVPPEWYQAPTFYFTNPHGLIGAHDDVAVPGGSLELDFELEVAAVIGRDGSSLSPTAARGHIFGYTVMNDWSARDLKRREMRVLLGPAKGKDFATTLGPWLTTADELDRYRDADDFLALGMSVSVNGTEIGRDLLSNMGWWFEDLAAYASRDTWVRAGDVLGSGTCGNGGASRSCGAGGDAPTRQPYARATSSR
jgi:2-keto-4-pentenoate hydratase/2-oxohepta-3-ene-1,7-dioic acid hydratase in catechol pathway